MSKFKLKEGTVDIVDGDGKIVKVTVSELTEGERSSFSDASQKDEKSRLPSLVVSMGVRDPAFAQSQEEWRNEPPEIVLTLMRKVLELSNLRTVDKTPEEDGEGEASTKQPDA